MLKIYCQDCGAPTVYSNSKPKFCSSCGKPFDKNIVVNQVQLQKPTLIRSENFKKTLIDDDDIYDEDDASYEDVKNVPNINKIDFEISELSHKKIQMKDILPNIQEETQASKEEKIKKIKQSRKGSKIKDQEFLNQFKAEAGTLRPSMRRTRKSSDG